MKKSSEVQITRFYKEKPTPFKHRIVHEEPLALFINGKPYVTMMRMPGHEKELVIGFLFTEGLVDGLKDVLYLKHCGSGQEEQNRVDVELAAHCPVEAARNIEARSACGLCSRTFIDELYKHIAPLENFNPLVAASTLLLIEADLLEHQREFKNTGAVHAAALYDASGKLLKLMEDIGRHNALDKLIGHAILQGWDLKDKIAVTTGRTSFEMAYKALRAKIPVLASVSAPTSMALELSRRLGLTMINFFRKEGFNLYTFPERIIHNDGISSSV